MFCSSDSWDSAICRSEPGSRRSVIALFYLLYSGARERRSVCQFGRSRKARSVHTYASVEALLPIVTMVTLRDQARNWRANCGPERKR